MILSPDGMVWSAGGRLRWPDVAGEHVGIGEEPEAHMVGGPVQWASGCALFTSVSAFEQAGPLDERLFLYLEDVEWCLRARGRGVAIHYVPEARIRHGVTKTIRRIEPRITRYYAYRNFYLVGFRHSSPIWKGWFAAHLGFTLAKAAARNAVSPSYRADSYYNARTRALLAALSGRSGKAPYEHRLDLAQQVTA
jgi:GT2 family glycosyltransferase